MKRYAIRNKATGKYLSTKPAWRPRRWVNLKDAALWVHRGHATLAARNSPSVQDELKSLQMDPKFRAYMASVANYPVELVEFDMFLIDSKVGTLTAVDISNQK